MNVNDSSFSSIPEGREEVDSKKTSVNPLFFEINGITTPQTVKGNNARTEMTEPSQPSVSFTNIEEVPGEDVDKNIDTLISVVYGHDLSTLPDVINSSIIQRKNIIHEEFLVIFPDTDEDDLDEGQSMPDSGVRLYWIGNKTYVDFTETELKEGLERTARYLESNKKIEGFLDKNPNFLNKLNKSISDFKPTD